MRLVSPHRMLKILRLKLRLSPTQLIVIAFAAIMLTGGFALSLPISSRSGQWTSFIDALFTAVSATCVTGLVVVDTYQYWSGFGQAVILTLIQIGGLGLMTFSTLASFLLRRSISLKERMAQVQSLNMQDIQGIIRLTRNILIGTFSAEATGALILSFRLLPDFGFPGALFRGVFHSVSAFCNAGFDIMGEKSQFTSLTGYVSDPTVNLVVMGLVVAGGLGFLVWEDIYQKRSFRRLTVYSKMVIVITGILILFGAAFIFALEYGNPETLGRLGFKGKVLAAFFQSVTARTAGFNTVDMSSLRDSSKAVMTFLMYIGGSSGSTAGGIKTVTFGILAVMLWRSLKGHGDVVVGRRRISEANVYRAWGIVGISLAIVLGGSMFISIVNHVDITSALFEMTSAFGTVGLTLGITASLVPASKILVMLTMFFGRVGIFTIAYAIAVKSGSHRPDFRYPECKVLIG